MMIQRLTLAGRAAQRQRGGGLDADTRGTKAALVILTILTYNVSAAVITKASRHTGDAPLPRNAKDSGGTRRPPPLEQASYLMH